MCLFVCLLVSVCVWPDCTKIIRGENSSIFDIKNNEGTAFVRLRMSAFNRKFQIFVSMIFSGIYPTIY